MHSESGGLISDWNDPPICAACKIAFTDGEAAIEPLENRSLAPDDPHRADFYHEGCFLKMRAVSPEKIAEIAKDYAIYRAKADRESINSDSDGSSFRGSTLEG
jgi:hypothetical protein